MFVVVLLLCTAVSPPTPPTPPHIRVVVFIDQLRELLELVLSKWNTLTDDQKAEVAQHIRPEVAEGGGEGIRRGVTCDYRIVPNDYVCTTGICSINFTHKDTVMQSMYVLLRWNMYGT